MADNFFELNDKFNIESPWGDWIKEAKLNSQKARLERLKMQKKNSVPEMGDFGNSANLVSAKKIAYLTFDDGLQPGTQEVLEVLREKNISATFFLTGVHVRSFIERIDRSLGLNMLREIYSKHTIGNHSYSHANDYYKNYYSKGLKVGQEENGDFIYRSVYEDFRKNDEIITEYLIEAGIDVPRGNKYRVARFPGRNTWYDEIIQDPVDDTTEEAKELYKRGYKLYGWDTEWEMNFQIVDVAKSEIQDNVDEKEMEWDNEDHTHPFFNLYSDEFIDKDRVNEDSASVRDDIEDLAHRSTYQPFDEVSKKSEKVILLMHERAFRYGKDKDTVEMDKLKSLIDSLKTKGFSFEKMLLY